jgi:DNA-binding NtrC family response regulator
VANTQPDDTGGDAPAATAEPLLFHVFDCDRPLQLPTRHLLDVETVVMGRGPRGCERRDRELSITIDDRRVSAEHARLTRVFGRWRLEDLGSRNGTVVNGARVARALLADGDLIELGRAFFLFRSSLPGAPDAAVAPGDLATLLPTLAEKLALLAEVARSAVPILLVGETGTGKDVTAQAIHRLSERPGPFVAINCGALPEGLVESELFGHRRGAFSGAAEDRPGLVRAADGGTLLLDEIGDLEPPSQAAFLRVLESHEVLPVGSTRPIKVDLRVVAATHRDLDGMIAAGRFRSDLYARLAGLVVRLPPLRERREDLGMLIARLIERLAGTRAAGVGFTSKAARALFRHSWPLNVRELEKCLSTALVVAQHGTIDLLHLPAALQELAPTPSTPAPNPPAGDERGRMLMDLLREHQGNVSEVARALGRSRMQIHRLMRRYQIDPKRYR